MPTRSERRQRASGRRKKAEEASEAAGDDTVEVAAAAAAAVKKTGAARPSRKRKQEPQESDDAESSGEELEEGEVEEEEEEEEEEEDVEMAAAAAYRDEEESDEDMGSLSDNELRRRLASGELQSVSMAKYGATPKRQRGTYKRDELLSTLSGFEISSKLGWRDTVTVTVPLSAEFDIEDEFARENAFCEMALDAAKEGERRLKAAAFPIIRPDDYFAEMLKSDDHMRKVREKMLDEQQSIQASENARRNRELKKMGKTVQRNVHLQRQKEKREAIASASRFRGGLQGAGEGAGGDDFDVSVDQSLQHEATAALKAAPGQKKKRAPAEKKLPNAKRRRKDAKYGAGGKKKYAKSNTAESTNDDHFSIKKNKAPFSRDQKSAPKKRAGKSKRQQQGGRR